VQQDAAEQQQHERTPAIVVSTLWSCSQWVMTTHAISSRNVACTCTSIPRNRPSFHDTSRPDPPLPHVCLERGELLLEMAQPAGEVAGGLCGGRSAAFVASRLLITTAMKRFTTMKTVTTMKLT